MDGGWWHFDVQQHFSGSSRCTCSAERECISLQTAFSIRHDITSTTELWQLFVHHQISETVQPRQLRTVKTVGNGARLVGGFAVRSLATSPLYTTLSMIQLAFLSPGTLLMCVDSRGPRIGQLATTKLPFLPQALRNTSGTVVVL